MKFVHKSFKALRSICLTLVFFLGFITIVATGGGGGDGGNSPPIINTIFEAEESFFAEVEAGYGALLLLEGINGDIIITGVNDTNSAVITGMKRFLTCRYLRVFVENGRIDSGTIPSPRINSAPVSPFATSCLINVSELAENVD